MSAERKKLLWISLSACVFVLAVLAVGFALLSPKRGAAMAPAAIGNGAPPKAQDPQDFLSAPPQAPAPAALEQPRGQDGGVIVVYGDKPKLPEGGQASGAASPANGAASATSSGVPPSASFPAASAAAVGVPGKAPQPSTTSSAAPAKAPQAGASPAAAKKPLAKPASQKVDEFWIQAASFTSRGRADDLKQALADKGHRGPHQRQGHIGQKLVSRAHRPQTVKADADDWLGRLKDTPGCAEAYVSKLRAAKPSL